MSIFMTKKKRERLEQEHLRNIELAKQRNMQSRIKVKRTLVEMRNSSKRLEQFKSSYIHKARHALQLGNQQTYKMAKTGLKLCLTKQKFLDSMIINFEIAMEMTDMNKVIEQFMDGINIITDQMKEITAGLDFTKAQSAFEEAMSKNATQYEALDIFLSEAMDSFETIDISSINIPEDEVDNIITNQAINAESELDKEIESKLQMVRDKLAN